ncbi:uncharacterized protein TNCV_2148041 [Trichonephila clavipes]|uniref:Uncharacterized protein n=1 Tax=Trichonephila clavipes TaxID=2585209 RepID=A0A8X6SVD5_TRICX|nr:uncharacterized protein TNCV_2148041 [Trichonephila clavipes]
MSLHRLKTDIRRLSHQRLSSMGLRTALQSRFPKINQYQPLLITVGRSCAFGRWGTLNSRRAASPLVRLMEGEERWETPDHLQGVLPQNWGGTEPKRTCMVLKATNNDRHTSSSLPR